MTQSILILGDSHVNIYQNTNLYSHFKVLNIVHTDCEDASRTGQFIPYLMNTIADRGEIYLSRHIQNFEHERIDYIMFIFGEPDIRIHFDKQINILNRNEDEVINTLCTKYLQKLNIIVQNKAKIIVRYVLPQRSHSMFGEWVPKGSIHDRVRYTTKVNKRLKELCEENDMLFFDNYENKHLTDENGILKDEYCDGTTHYNSNTILKLNTELDHFVSSFVTN
jgi:hypothetical protein